MDPPVVVAAWIDFLCPWSWVALTRLERVAEEYGEHVEIEWHAFMRYPEKKVHDLDEWRRSTVEWMEPAAAESGLVFSLWATSNAPPTHSAPALAAALVAEDEDPVRAGAYRRALFGAYFSDNRTISDGGTLIAIAREVGIDEDAFAMRLRGRYARYVGQVIDDHKEGAKRGVADAPSVIIADEFLVRGPATDEQYRDVLDQVLTERGVALPDRTSGTDVDAPAVAEDQPAGTDGSTESATAVPDVNPAAGEEAATGAAGASSKAEQPAPEQPAAEQEAAEQPAAEQPSAEQPGAEQAAGSGSPADGVADVAGAASTVTERGDTPTDTAPPASTAPATKASAKKVPAKKAPAKKTPAKKAPAKKAPAKKRTKKKAAGSAPSGPTPASGSSTPTGP